MQSILLRAFDGEATAMLRMTTILGIILLIVTLGCGGSGLPSSSAVSVSISPPSAVIGVGQSVDLVGTASGFTRPTIDWWEQDQHDASVNGYGEENCDDITPAESNLIASCPFGYLTGSAMVEASTETATYHAQMTPGTYHVTFRAFQVSVHQAGDVVEKRTTATITVTP